MATSKVKAHCSVCEQSEERCECEKYCVFCQGQIAVRLCEDGLYYCQACREACDSKVSYSPRSAGVLRAEGVRASPAEFF